MKALNHKLWRDLWKMKGQVLAIILVIVGGIATFVMMRSTMHSLKLTQASFYQEYRFGDLFASLKRAPESLKARIAELDGVEQVETRVVAAVKIRVPGLAEPASARLVSLPDDGQPLLNRLYLQRGRMPEPWKENEALVSEQFADANHLALGDPLGVVINGKWRTLTVVGVVLCPEFIYAVRPGSVMPDYKRYGILWMRRTALAAAYQMQGAFNDVVMTIAPGLDPDKVITRVDDLLSWYGGLGAYAREDQMSHRFLTEEFRGLETMARVFPIMFIGVAAFLLQVVISRTVSTQREQIAALRAFGYDKARIALHYIQSVLVISAAGAIGGIAVGLWLGGHMGNIYMAYYRFPYLMNEIKPSVILTAVIVSVCAALAGTVHAVWKAAALPPAEAMRPEPPASYRRSVIEHLGLWSWFSQSSRIIIRNIERRPLRSLFSITGVALSSAVMISAAFVSDAMDLMVDLQFRRVQREDMTVSFIEPTSRAAIYELRSRPGVRQVEPYRVVPAQLRYQHRTYLTSIQGIEPSSRLHRLLDGQYRAKTVPPAGILMTGYLASLLGVMPGDILTVEMLEGDRPVYRIPIAGLIDQYVGVSVYMDLAALNRVMKEDQAISGVYLTIDSQDQTEFFEDMLATPRVAGTTIRQEEINSFYQFQAEAMLFMTSIAAILAGSIAFGVIYNNARISLSERSRELASLRVLGYTRSEISFIFLGELALLTVAAIPIGCFLGKLMSGYLAVALASDLFRIPALVESGTYALAAVVVLVSAGLSGLIVRQRLDHLDLVAVLKTKE